MTQIRCKYFPGNKYIPVLAFSLVSHFGISFAEDKSFTEESYLLEFPVVLSASRLQQPLADAPNAMTVIDREMITASGFRTIPDLFRLVPGMYVSAYEGNDPIVAYHGSTDQMARRMQVLVDGRTVFMPPIGAVSWETLPLQIDDIERIEVIRGPAAASHGGNSTQGVLNIITRDAAAFQGFRASVTKGNGGISDATVNIGQSKDKLDYRLSFGYRSDDGYDANNFNINNDSHQTRLFNLRSNYQLNTVDSFDFQFGYTDSTRGIGKANSGSANTEPNAPHNKFNNENFTQISWVRSLDESNELKLQYYHIYQDEQNFLPPIDPFPALNDSYTNTRDDLELQHTLHTSQNNRFVWGASARSDWTRAPARFLEEQNVFQTTLFAHDEWRMSPEWLLNTGAMQENSGLGQNNLSPRIALIYKLAEKQHIRFGLSKAYRNPSVYEERGNYHFPDPINTLYSSTGGLRAENVTSQEIGYLGEFPDQGLSIDARIYHDKVNDIIYETDQGPTPKNFINLFDAEHNGFEMTTKHQWGDRNKLTFNYAYQVLSSDLSVSYAGAYSESMPRNMISALYSKTFSGEFALSIGLYQQDTMLPIDRPGYDRQYFTSRWDTRLAKGFKNKNLGFNGEVALVIQGLTGEQHVDYVVGNQYNQRIFCTATIIY